METTITNVNKVHDDTEGKKLGYACNFSVQECCDSVYFSKEKLRWTHTHRISGLKLQ
jgi:hypothetical protein